MLYVINNFDLQVEVFSDTEQIRTIGKGYFGSIWDIEINPNTDELYIADILARENSKPAILVFDLLGNYIRKITI